MLWLYNSLQSKGGMITANGGGGGGSFLLDDYTGAAAGYSVRRIASGATNLMRIREDAGDTETDIGYDSNNQLDTAAIATHCGAANGFVVSWVDQSGNSNNATQGTEASQPKIYDGTTQEVITKNGKPALSTNGSQYLTHSSLTFSSDLCFVNVQTARVGNAGYGGASGHFGAYAVGTDRFRWRFSGSSSDLLGFAAFTAGDQYTSVINRAGSSVTMYYNGATYQTTGASNTSTATFTQLMAGNGTGSLTLLGNSQEIIYWDSDQSSNRTGIETDINSEYLIYQPTDAPTSGLLTTYTGAAAAYSVRQLANTAVMSMRVRRDSDDVEQNFGFDSNGDLDTAGIASFCGTANGYVTRWWDQSNNGNHADQATDASQPQIYNGTAVITENGKAAIDFDGSSSFLDDISVASATANTIATVVRPDNSQNLQKIFARPNSSSGQLRVSSNTYRFVDYELSPTTFTDSQIIASTTQELLFAYVTNTNKTARLGKNGGTFDVGDTLTKDLQIIGTAETNAVIGRHRTVSQEYYDGKIQEFILWTTDHGTSNRSGIETNINDYFSIYT